MNQSLISLSISCFNNAWVVARNTCFSIPLSLCLASKTEILLVSQVIHQMVKEMRFDSNPLSLYKNKHNHVFVKFAVSFVLLGLAFRLFVSDSIRFSSVNFESQQTQIHVEEANTGPPVPSAPPINPLSADFHPNETHISSNQGKFFSPPSFGRKRKLQIKSYELGMYFCSKWKEIFALSSIFFCFFIAISFVISFFFSLFLVSKFRVMICIVPGFFFSS